MSTFRQIRSLCFILFYFFQITKTESNGKTLHFHMPNVVPAKETYFCTAHRLPFEDFEYIVGFTPNATMKKAHHMLLYGCEDPGYYERDTPTGVWDCGEMGGSANEVIHAQVCKGKSHIIYAWAMDAPKLVLPEGVGFKVGGKTGINFLVLQVHYANSDLFDGLMTDSSGIDLSILPSDTKKVTKRAGILLLGTGGFLPLGIEHMEVAGRLAEPVELHPFAFRTHTHKLGKVVSGWRINEKGWTLIGKHNPQEPQMFYPMNHTMVMKKGDIVAARCTMDNNRDHYVSVGFTGNDEMCNFYIMYYVHGDRILEEDTIFSNGPPAYYWKNDFHVPKEIHEKASQL